MKLNLKMFRPVLKVTYQEIVLQRYYTPQIVVKVSNLFYRLLFFNIDSRHSFCIPSMLSVPCHRTKPNTTTVITSIGVPYGRRRCLTVPGKVCPVLSDVYSIQVARGKEAYIACG